MNEPMNQVVAALAAAVSETMEGMAFEQVDLAEDQPIGLKSEEDNLWVSLEIVRPLSGQVIMEMSRAYAAMLARAMYGELEAAIPGDVIWDTLSELTNTLAGRFLLELLGSKEDYTLGFPVTGRGVCPICEDLIASLHFSGFEHDLQVAVTGEDFRQFLETKDHAAEVTL